MIPLGMMQTPHCIVPTTDAGKPCRGKADCEAGCLLAGYTKEKEPLGQCSKDNNLFGCRMYVLDSRAIGVCTD